LDTVLAVAVPGPARAPAPERRGPRADRPHRAGESVWGAERIRGELLKLGLVVSKRSVQKYRRRGPAGPPSPGWRIFLRNHRASIWAADLLTVRTIAFRTLYVLVFVSHARRELVHFNVTSCPTAAWVWHQLIAATPWERTPRYLVRDRDVVYGGDFVERSWGLGIETLLTPIRAPRANAIAETADRDAAPRVP